MIITNMNYHEMEFFVVGSSGHAKEVISAIKSRDGAILGVITEVESATPFLGIEQTIENSTELDLNEKNVVIGIGDNRKRKLVYSKIRDRWPKANFPPVVHHGVYIPESAVLGDGTVILSNAAIGPEVRIGVGTLIQHGVAISHNSSLGTFSSVGLNSVLAGDVKVGNFVTIEMLVSISRGVEVGSFAHVGSNSFINVDVPANVLVYGVPARLIKSNLGNEIDTKSEFSNGY